MKIFRYIIHSPDIKVLRRKTSVSKDEDADAPFSFSPAVDLQLVNKNIYLDERLFFQDVSDFKVSLRWIAFKDVVFILHTYDIPFFFPNKQHPFNNPVAKVMVRSRKIGPCTTSFAVFLEDIPSLCGCLQMLDLEHGLFLKFAFGFLGMSTVATQAQVLEPFEHVVGVLVTQEVLITGNVDTALSLRVQGEMTQSVGWLRALSWSFYNSVVSLKEKGDEYFKTGDFVTAALRYARANDFRDAVCSFHSWFICQWLICLRLRHV